MSLPSLVESESHMARSRSTTFSVFAAADTPNDNSAFVSFFVTAFCDDADICFCNTTYICFCDIAETPSFTAAAAETRFITAAAATETQPVAATVETQPFCTTDAAAETFSVDSVESSSDHVSIVANAVAECCCWWLVWPEVLKGNS